MQAKHSMQDVAEIQARFEQQFAAKRGVVGIGIGRNRAKTDYALKVLVTDRGAAARVPEQFEGTEVVVDIVGTASAF